MKKSDKQCGKSKIEFPLKIFDNGPIAYDAITGRPIYEHGGCYDPGYDD